MYTHFFGLTGQVQPRIICLLDESTEVGMIYVSSVRLNVSNQSVLMDRTLVILHPDQTYSRSGIAE
jgi:hypothetical protein